jgi:hypothetical protein
MVVLQSGLVQRTQGFALVLALQQIPTVFVLARQTLACGLGLQILLDLMRGLALVTPL